MTWAANLTVGTFSGWRLPTTTQPDATCSSQFDPGSPIPIQGFSFNCTGSEMGYMWYTELGNTAGSLTNTGDFLNLRSNSYWSGTEYAPFTTNAWVFLTVDGFQLSPGKLLALYAVAVRPGDVAAAVPEPQTFALALAGLAALRLVRRRRPSRVSSITRPRE